MTTSILIDPKNPAEALGCYGILCLDHLLGKGISRTRFVSARMEEGLDGEFRAYVFELEHADGFESTFLRRCCRMEIVGDEKRLWLEKDGQEVLPLDWHQPLTLASDRRSRLWLPKRDKNFSPDNVFKSQHRAMQDVVEAVAKGECTSRHLFSRPIQGRPSHLTGYNPLNVRSFLDAGGVFDNSKSLLYASEWFCMIALQGLRHYFEEMLERSKFISYSVWTEWLPTCAAFAAVAGHHPSCEDYQSELVPKNNLLVARLGIRV